MGGWVDGKMNVVIGWEGAGDGGALIPLHTAQSPTCRRAQGKLSPGQPSVCRPCVEPSPRTPCPVMVTSAPFKCPAFSPRVGPRRARPEFYSACRSPTRTHFCGKWMDGCGRAAVRADGLTDGRKRPDGDMGGRTDGPTTVGRGRTERSDGTVGRNGRTERSDGRTGEPSLA